MSHSTQHIKANQRRAKFASLLREMFQLDQPELDFGLYRIMHARQKDITRFIDEDLPQIAKDAFTDFASGDKVQLDKDLTEARKGAQAAGIDPEDSPKVKELEALYTSGFDVAREEGEVYDALVTFFGRYYSEGDFISQRRYGDGTYAIPYDGEEVKLHWANKDQYYIKSSETLRDYSFRLSPNAGTGTGEDPLRVHFKLVDATAGAKDNNKEATSSKRVFVLDADEPFTIEKSEPDADGYRFDEFHCRFHFRPATMEDWTERKREKFLAKSKAKKKNEALPDQDHLRAIAEERLLSEASNLPAVWRTALAQRYRKADGELAEYSTFRGQLNNYSKKNTSDYFIHKDLGGFLTRELDFYLKHELMSWADLAAAKNDPARLAPLLSKLDAVRTLGEKIITFLAQLENFQKKLWLKKKFVTETNYCITLDRLADQPELLEQVFTNDTQKQDWEKLYRLDLAALEQALTDTDAATVAEQSEYCYLMLDTAHFDAAFKAQLRGTIDNLDEQCDGLLIHSENFQALNLLQERYREQVKCVYIDPPYNAPNSEIAYKNNYKHSSFLSLIHDRIASHASLLTVSGSTALAIDKNEENAIFRVIKDLFPHNDNILVTVEHNRKGVQGDHFSYTNEYAIFSISQQLRTLSRTDRVQADWEWSNLRNWGGESRREDAANCFYSILVKHGEIIGFGNVWTDPLSHPPSANVILGDDVIEVFPIDNAGEERKWRYERGTVEAIAWKLKAEINQNDIVQIKIAKVDDQFKTVWYSPKYNAGDNGTQLVRDLGLPLGEFDYPKSIHTTRDCVHAVSSNSDMTMDYFAGSGTTGHAVINLNREDDGQRKYILVEMGDYFDTVLKPRIQKVVYSKDWKDGAPTAPETGVSHCFKYLRLESYEDTLGNLELERKPGMEQLFTSTANDAARQSYVMQYLLDVETSGSPSLLNIKQFLDPTRYELRVRSAGGDETVPVNVDLLETFNYLLGLTVEHIAAPMHFAAEIEQGEYGRWQAQVKQAKDGRWWFRTVYGTNRNGQQVLVVWRNLPSVMADEAGGINRDNAVLDAVLVEKLKIRLTESTDDEIDILYVNGDHNIHIPRDRKGQLMEQARIELIEEAFQRLMFADTDAVQ
jgi:adenine-specific DNA-methyltransferase